MDPKEIGELIKKLRKENNLTQKEFAEKLGVTYQAVSKWENGKNMPDIVLLKDISKIFKIDIKDLLEGEIKKREKQNQKIYLLFIIILLILAIITFIIATIYNNKNNSFQFKKITSTCEDFTITGSAAYNKDKTSIYISNVDYCGKYDNTIYKEIECILYEDYKDTKTKIGTCGKNTTNMTLGEFLNTVEFSVNNYVASCKMFTSSKLSLEIKALTEDNKKTTYEIPIELEENCKK